MCSVANPFFKALILSLLLLAVLSVVSGVSAVSFNNGNATSSSVQNFINTGSGDNDLVLESGDYNNLLKDINVSRSLNIRGNGQVNLRSSSGGSLFNITAMNVNITNLNILGYGTAIKSNTSNLQVIGTNITTNDVSVNLTGFGDLTGILIENNAIISSVNYLDHGAVYITTIQGYKVNMILKNNNITANGTNESTCVRLKFERCSNVNLFENNNLIGSLAGVALSVARGNNTINFNNNNITGKHQGVYLYVFNSNNTIKLINNIICSNDFSMFVFVWQEVSGLSIINNTIVSNGTGLWFSLSHSPPVLSNINVTGNLINATDFGVDFDGSGSVNMCVNYNRVLANVGLDFTDVTNAGSDFDYNWWGVNNISSKIINFNTNNHYILNITNLTSLEHRHPGDNVSFAFLVLNTTRKNTGVENLPYFEVNGTFNGMEYETNRDSKFEHTFHIAIEGIQTLGASVDEASDIITFGATKLATNSTIHVSEDPRTGKTTTIHGVLTDADGKPIANAEIEVTIDGKVHELRTSADGRWSLSYKPTKTGKVSVHVKYAGSERYHASNNETSFDVQKGKINIGLNVDVREDGSVEVTVKVTDEDGDPVADNNVKIDLDGKHVGNIVTDSNGVGRLVIPAKNIEEGEHTITALFDHTDYDVASVSANFVEPKNNSTNGTNKTNKTNNTSNNSAALANAAMKKTGIPMIFLVLLAIFGLITYRRNE
jgi:protocatechuate 3,4-dioxygenase beta subunit